VADLVATGMAALWVSHDRNQVERVADQVVHLRSGRVVG
jgi:ABC-type sugar transport system ATPase subunit